MPTVRGPLGQSAPLATTLTDIYTAPAAKQATGRVFVTNRGNQPATFRISVAVDGAADADEQYVAWDKAITGNDTGSTVAFFVGNDDVVRVFASNGNLSFTFTGIEVDN